MGGRATKPPNASAKQRQLKAGSDSRSVAVTIAQSNWSPTATDFEILASKLSLEDIQAPDNGQRAAGQARRPALAPLAANVG
jgi:hypothetical protein